MKTQSNHIADHKKNSLLSISTNHHVRTFTEVRKIGFMLTLFFSTLQYISAVTYYTGANGSPSATASWWTNVNGTGSHPSNFTTAADVFIIQTGHTMTTTANWTVAGTVSVTGTLTANSSSTTCTFGILTVNTGGIVNMQRPMTVGGATTISGTINFSSTSNSNRAMVFTGDRKSVV